MYVKRYKLLNIIGKPNEELIEKGM